MHAVRPTAARPGSGGEVDEGLSGLDTVGSDRGPPGVETGEPAAPRPAAAAERPRNTFLDVETMTEPDTVGGLDTDPPENREETSQSWQEGTLIANRFRLVRSIGQGGMGKVYLAQDETLKRAIALKRIPQEIIFDVDARDDLRQEANRLLDLAHENIVRVHTYYDGPTWPFFAMEYLQGPTLKSLLRERRRDGRAFTPNEVLAIARQVGQGLAHAHAHSVVHRDLKPANLMFARPPGDGIAESDVIKITDFGISRVIADSTLRQTGRRSGTLPYMSPEQFRGDPCTARSDIYSFACTLYELLSGVPPFFTGDIGYQILHIEPRPLEGVPRHTAVALYRALAKDPEDRFASVEEFIAALEGRIRVPDRRFVRGIVALGSKMLGGIAFALLVLWLAYRVYNPPATSVRTDRDPGPRNVHGVIAALDIASTLEETQRKVETFRGWFQEALNRRARRVYGRASGIALAPGAPPAIDIQVDFVESDAPSGAALLAEVLLKPVPLDPAGLLSAHEVRGTSHDGITTFVFKRLREGTYDLQALLAPRGAAPSSRQEICHRELIVDLTPPVFDVEPVEPQALVTPARRAAGGDPVKELVTFEESVVVHLTTGGAREGSGIQKAYYHIVSPTSISSSIPIEDPVAWKLPSLAPGERRHLRIFAEDAAGNRSDPRDLVLRRYQMELKDFVTAGVEGNVARVRGTFRHEGDVHPDLVFAVNGHAVDADWRILPHEIPAARVEPASAALDGEDRVLDLGRTREVPFEALLVLDRATNSIEARYAWKGRDPVRFPMAGSLERVNMRAPSIELGVPGGYGDHGDPKSRVRRQHVVRTSRPTVTVRGDVAPYFSGLRLVLVVRKELGPENLPVSLDPSPVGTTARFEVKDLALQPNVVNIVSVRCYYKEDRDELIPTLEPLEIYCDQTRPAATLRYEMSGKDLLVRIEAAEPLEALWGAIRVAESDMQQWVEIPVGVALDLVRPVYTWRVGEPPDQVVSFDVKMRDLAGNEATTTEVYFPSSAGEADRPGPANPAVGRPGTIVLRSGFLRDMGMEFVVCGPSRLEMSRTEVPEAAWFLFLEEKGLRTPAAGRGRSDYPMVPEERHVRLLPEFVEWFQAKAQDGYVYSIPTEDTWLSAFTGARNSKEAKREIQAWFSPSDGEFKFRQAERYGTNWMNRIGSRPENATPTQLLDMEANVQELVLDSRGLLAVIGGYNQLDDPTEIERSCLGARPYSADQRQMLGRWTGLRLCRWPKASP